MGIQNEAGQSLKEFCKENALEGHSKHPLATTQGKTLHTKSARWSILKSDWLYSLQPKMEMQKSAKARSGADCGSDCEHFIVKFWLKLKKVGKITKSFRYDLNQIPYDYTVEVWNRFKGLDLIVSVPGELWNEVHDIVQETGIKTIPTYCSVAKKIKNLPLNCGCFRTLSFGRKLHPKPFSPLML